MKKIVYVTGCLGFIGSHITRRCLEKDWKVVGVDKITHVSNKNLLLEFQNNKNFIFLQSDINDLTHLYDCDYIINTAAETHVDNSITGSNLFLTSNVNGVYNLLELIKKQPIYKAPILLHFSTDEVYGDTQGVPHTEKDLLKPSNPYSASKAAADMLIQAWARTYGIKYTILRPTNNYGIGQYVEKLIPKSIKYLELGRLIDLHDGGNPYRTWLHVDDTVNATMAVIESGSINEIYNASGNVELQNKEVVKKILNKYFEQNHDGDWQMFTVNSNRPGQDIRYNIDDGKLKKLGWRPMAKFDEELVKIVEYYRSNFIW